MEVTLKAKRPGNKKGLRSFFDTVGYYGKFFENFTFIAKPMTDMSWKGGSCALIYISAAEAAYQSGRSPKVVALFSATNFSSNIIEMLQLHDTIQIK